MAANSDGLRLQVQRLDNGTFIATFLLDSNSSDDEQSLERLLNPRDPDYDDQGALYYVTAVIFIYGISIILMIASLVRKNNKDNGMSNYMKDIDKVRRLERRQQKFKTRLIMQMKNTRSQSLYKPRDVAGRGGDVTSDAGKSSKPDGRRSESLLARDSASPLWDSGGGSRPSAHTPLVKSKSDPDYGTRPGRQAKSGGWDAGVENELLIGWDDDAETPEPSSPSLAVLEEEEEEDDRSSNVMHRSELNKGVDGEHFKMPPKQIVVNIDNVETKLLVSVV